MNPDEMKRCRALSSVTSAPLISLQEALIRCLEEIEERQKVTGFLFPNVSCSHCGKTFGPGNHGYSHCDNHA